MRKQTWFTGGVVMLGLALNGCGGGGGGSSAPTTYDLDALVSAYVRVKHDYTLSATSGGNTFTLQLGSVPGPSATFGTLTADTSAATFELFENGTLVGNDTSTRFYEVNPYEPIGEYDATTGYVTVYGGQQRLPSAATVGDTGSLATATIYYDTSLTSVFGTLTDTWTLNAASGGDAVFCADLSESTASGPSTESDCYTIDPAGNVLGLTITLLVNGVEVTFQ